mmetsp:Transcript_13035/g.34460  ORF Transcript_13035/g.34460 Transcript_13035/m.34460 type:complete len:295 (+) Transcript_13035:90-974(+)
MPNAVWARSTRREMKKGQNDIDYITGEIIVLASSSPFVNMIRKKNLNGSLAVGPDEHAVQQLKESDGEKLKSMIKEGMNIEEEDDKNKLKELKTKHEPLTKLMKVVLGIMKAHIIRDYSMTFYMAFKKNMEINLKHSIMSELKETVAMNKSDKIVKDMIRLLLDILQQISGFNFDEMMHFTVDLRDEYVIQQQKGFDGTKLRAMMKEGLDIENEHENKKPNELKERFALSIVISQLISGFDLEELTQFASHIRRMINLGLSISDDHEDLHGNNETFQEKVEGAADEASKVKEVK